MKLFKVFAGIIGFFVLIFVVSLFFPRTYKIERSIEINLPVSVSFNYLNTMQNWSDWSPWNNSIDSSMTTFYSKVKSGPGATEYFNGNVVGTGRLRILDAEANKKIHYQLSINEGTMQSQATFYFSEVNGKTHLSWVDEGDVGYNPLFRFLLPSKITSTGEAFEKSLVDIKTAAEKNYQLRSN